MLNLLSNQMLQTYHFEKNWDECPAQKSFIRALTIINNKTVNEHIVGGQWIGAIQKEKENDYVYAKGSYNGYESRCRTDYSCWQLDIEEITEEEFQRETQRYKKN